MAPLDEHLRRTLPAVGDWQATSLRRAAVLCPLVLHDGEDHVLMLVRPDTLREHAGQVAFPGGMQDGDETPLQTALRECHEEIGVEAQHVMPLGCLPSRPSSSRILVHCIVARLAPVPLTADAAEVARVLHVPLAALRDPSGWHEREHPGLLPGSPPRTSPHFAIGDDLLWGLTGRFVHDLLEALRS